MVLPLSSFVPVLFADNARCQFVIAQNGFPLAFSEEIWIHCKEVSYNMFFGCNEPSMHANEA